jgi:DNA-binding CsgD family transcriptional regulator
LPAAEVVAETQVLPAEPALPDSPRRVAAQVTDPFGLTAREREVLQLLATGLTDREIGDALFISWRTAQAHVSHIFTKLGVSTRTAAVAAALRTDLVPDDSSAARSRPV